MASMHAACYAHALVPSSLDEAQDSLDAFNKGEKGADACLEDLSETAAMVRSNVHADHSMLYSKTMIQLTLAAPAPTTKAGEKSALELYGAVLGLEACKKDAEAFSTIRNKCALYVAPGIPEHDALEKLSIGELKKIAFDHAVDVRLAIEKHHVIIALDAAR